MENNSGGDPCSHLCLVEASCCCTCVPVVLLGSTPKDFPHLQTHFPLLFLVAIRANGQSRSVTFTGLHVHGGCETNVREGFIFCRFEEFFLCSSCSPGGYVYE